MATIHVVDDEAMICLLVTYVLKKMGHQVHTYRSAGEFFEHSTNRPCDLVVTDFVMPTIDGLEFCRQLRARDSLKNTPIIIMSGFEIADDVADFARRTYGVVEILTKPFTIQMLMASVTRGLAADPKFLACVVEHIASSSPPTEAAPPSFGQRVQPRIKASLRVTLNIDNQDIPGVTADVSAGGLFVVADVAPAMFSPIRFTITASRGRKGGLELNGAVAHRGVSREGQPGIGIALQEQRLDKFYLWYELVARLQGISAPRQVNNRLLFLGFSDTAVIDLQTQIKAAREETFDLTTLHGWPELSSVPFPAARRLLVIDTRAFSTVEERVASLDLAALIQFQADGNGTVLVLGLEDETAIELAPTVELVCIGSALSERLVDIIRQWLLTPVRTAVRVPLTGEAEVAWSGQSAIACAIGDVSAGGMRLVSNQRLPADQNLALGFRLPRQSATTRAAAQVRWIQTQGPQRLVYGLAFVGLAAEATEAIAGYIDTSWTQSSRIQSRPS